MHTDNIKMLEEKLGIELPENYKKVLLNNPFEDKKNFRRVYTLLLDDVNDLISINLKLRKTGFQGVEWPNHFFIIGESKGELGYFFINVKKDNEKIFLASEDDKFNPISIARLLTNDSFEKYIEFVNDMQEILD